jgi:membrane-associated protease RseP (regulator of RpoE activity)
MFDPFLNIQLFWEETMASRIVEYLGSEDGEGKKMVLLTGGMHVEYGFGVPKKVVRRRPMPYSIVLSSATHIPEEKREEVLMDVDIPDIPLLSGDFLWMVPYEDLEDDQVRLGIMMTTKDGPVAVEKVMEGSAAEAAGIRAGDELISLDGLAVEEMSDVIIVVRSKNPGEEIRIVLRRGGEELTLTARFPSRHEESRVE